MRLYILFVYTFVISCNVDLSKSAKILGFFPAPSKSHMIIGHSFFKILADFGHEVTIYTPLPLEQPYKNYKNVKIEDFGGVVQEKMLLMQNSSNPTEEFSLSDFHGMGLAITEMALKDKNVVDLLKRKEKFDVVIVETFMNEAHLALGHHFGAPVIGVSTGGACMFNNDISGNPDPPSYLPQAIINSTDHMSFQERLFNSILTVVKDIYRGLVYFPQQEALMHKYFPDSPDIYTVMHNVSLLFLNSHPSYSYPRPLMPNTVEIGGFHIPKPKPLPEDLKKYLDEAKNGVIYFSFGSVISSRIISPQMRQAFTRAFSKLNLKVLWKWDQDAVEDLSGNVKLGKWFPQPDILAHPNVKLFITHGGLGSFTESLWHGVPMIAIPFFGDQPMNAARMASLELGLSLKVGDISEEIVLNSINEVLTNPKYRNNIKKRSKLYRDQPQSLPEKINYWVEFIARYGGAEHLRPAVFDLYWFQYLSIDIASFIFLFFTLISVIVYVILKKIYRWIKNNICSKCSGCSKKNQKNKKAKIQ